MDALSSVFRPWSQRLVESPNLIHANINKKECIETLRTGTILESAWKRFKQNLTTVLSKKEKELFFLLEPGLDFFFSRHTIAVTLMYYEVFKKIFVEKQADAVVMYASGMTLERTAIQAAHTLHIPSIRLMHGLALSNTKWTNPDMNYVLSNNELEKKQYIQLGAPAKSIVVTGPIFLHNIKRYLKMKKQPNKQPHILFCTAPMIAENVIEKSRYFSYIQKFLAELKDVNGGRCTVKIKLHPLEKEGEEYRKIIQELQAPNINIVEGMEKNVLYGLIHECDAFVSFFSTTISEANLLGRLTILIDLYDHYFVDRFGIYFRNTEAVLKADPDTPAGTLRTLVEKVLFDESMRKDLASKRAKFVRLFFYKKDGRAPERAVKNIKKIIEENHSNHC